MYILHLKVIVVSRHKIGTKWNCLLISLFSFLTWDNLVFQAEYDENDKIGILGCGHDYHVDCIKRWLLLKNACPMCKRPAFSVDNNKC